MSELVCDTYLIIEKLSFYLKGLYPIVESYLKDFGQQISQQQARELKVNLKCDYVKVQTASRTNEHGLIT